MSQVLSLAAGSLYSELSLQGLCQDTQRFQVKRFVTLQERQLEVRSGFLQPGSYFHSFGHYFY